MGFHLDSCEYQNERVLMLKLGSHTAEKWACSGDHLFSSIGLPSLRTAQIFSLVKNFKTWHVAEVDYFIY